MEFQEDTEAIMADRKEITSEEWFHKRYFDVRLKIQKEEMNKLVMDLFVTEGWVDVAEMFNHESGTEWIDLATIMDRSAIRKAVECGNIEDAIEKINNLNPEILDKNPLVFFRLQQQRFIECIRDGKIEEALEIAQEELAPYGEKNQSILKELERTVALLGFADPTMRPSGELLNISQRQKTAREVNAAILTSQGREKDSKLYSVLNMLIWVQIELAKFVDFPFMDFLFEKIDALISASEE